MPVHLNKNKVLKRIRNGTDYARAVLTEQVKMDSDPLTPKDTGDLINTAIIDRKRGIITYIKPYAKKLWYGEGKLILSKDRNAQATFRWCDKAKENHKKDWDIVVQNAFRKGMR